MKNNNYKSVFDIIGPVMIGPSSSHTAGAAKMGKMALSIFGEPIEKANIFLFESFAETYLGHGTNFALAGGLLGMSPDDERLQESLLIAKENKITFNFIPLADKVEHPNTAKMVLHTKARKMAITGVSIGGGSAKIIQIDDSVVDIDGSVNTILIFHWDRPGMIALVANELSKLDINIATMKVDRESKGNKSYMVIELDHTDNDVNIEEIKKIDQIIDAIFIRV